MVSRHELAGRGRRDRGAAAGGAGARREAGRRAPARARPAHGARAHRAAGGRRELPRGRRDGGRRRARRSGPPRLVPPDQLRGRRGEDRRPSLRGGRRRLHHRRRRLLAGQPQEDAVRRRPRDPPPHPAGAPDRGRRRLGLGRLRLARPLGLRPDGAAAHERARDGGARDGAGGLRGARALRGLPRGAPRGLALLGDDAGHGGGARRAGPTWWSAPSGRSLTKEELGGAKVHTKSGVVDNVAEDEDDALRQIRAFLSYLPPSVWELPPVARLRRSARAHGGGAARDRAARAPQALQGAPRDPARGRSRLVLRARGAATGARR